MRRLLIGLTCAGVAALEATRVLAGLDVAPAPPATPDLSGYVRQTDMPVAGTATPPPVNATGAAGSAAQYARADHTHVSSILKNTLATTDASGLLTWTFPQVNGAPFFTAPPVVQISVESASGQPFVAQIVSGTATAVTIQVYRAQALPQNLVNALVSGVFNVFGGAVPVGTKVHVYAAKPTQ